MAERVISPELEVRFQEWVRGNNIEVALFDLDDTLINTNLVFTTEINRFLDFCENCLPACDREDIRVNLDKIDSESYQLMGIHPSKWDYVVGELGKLYGNEALIEGISIFHGIYNQAPEFNDGAEELLRQCKKAGLKLGLVTHSTHEWANLKIDSLGIREFLDHIVVADVTRYKGSEDWKSAIDLFGVDPARVLAAGDNIRGDILAAHEVGVRHLAWIPSNWHVYNTGQLPDGVCKVESIDKLIETLVA